MDTKNKKDNEVEEWYKEEVSFQEKNRLIMKMEFNFVFFFD